MSEGENFGLFNYPPQTIYGRVVSKSKIYEHGLANRRLKDLFVKEVDQIIWKSKLAPETINLTGKLGVPEIQVFTIISKTLDLSSDILRCIDDAVKFPTLFEIEYDGKIMVKAAYKRPRQVDPTKWVASSYFSSQWMLADTKRNDLPLVLDLEGLYKEMINQLIPIDPRDSESISFFVRRYEDIISKKDELDNLKKHLSKEKQFNRKVEINAKIKKISDELNSLIS